MRYNIRKNLVLSTVTKFSNIFMLVLLIFAGRLLGDELYGKLSVIMAFVLIFETIADLGLSEVTLRDVSQDRSKGPKYLGNLIVWKGILCLCILILISVTLRIIHYSKDIEVCIYLFAFSAFFKSYKYNFMAFYKAYDRYDLEAILINGEKLSILIFGICALSYYRTVVSLMAVFFLVRLVDLGVTIFIMKRAVLSARPKVDFKFVKKIQFKALPLGLQVYVVYLYCYVDTLILSIVRNNFEVGWYNAAYRIYDGFPILPFIAYYALLPPLSKYFLEDRRKHSVFSERAIKYIFIFSFLLSVILVLQSKSLINLLYGPAFKNSVLPLMILSPGLVFTFLTIISNCILISMDKLKILLYMSSAGLFANLVLNIFLIPRMGYIGAAVSTLISEILVFSLTIVYLTRMNELLNFAKIIGKPFLVGGMTILPLVVASRYEIPIPIMTISFILIYLASCSLFKIIDYQEINLMIRGLH